MNLDSIVYFTNKFLSEQDRILKNEYPSFDRIGGISFLIEKENDQDYKIVIDKFYNEVIKTINFCHKIILENGVFNELAKNEFITLKNNNLTFIGKEKTIYNILDYISDFNFFIEGKIDLVGKRYYYQNRQ